MILELETAVENYIRLLRAKGYYVTFCFRRDTGFCALPAKYNIHYHPYCLALKTSPEAWDQCIRSQKKVYERLKNGAFFGMCHAGVEEFVFPIPGGAQQDKIIGFVSVSGFKTRETEAKKRVRRVAEEYLISKETLFGLYQKLSPQPPEFASLRAEIEPLCFLLSYLSALTESDGADNSERSLYSRLLTYVNRHFADGITLRDISKNCFCSLSAVSHVFVKHQGVPVMKYIQEKRLTEAKTLLLDSDFSVKTISEMTGFSDSNYFISCFKKAYGLPPAAFRKKSKKSV